MLTQEQKRRLLQVARQSVYAAVRGEPTPNTATDDPALKRIQGAFVTLEQGGQLRGCIGRLESTLPLIETVAQMARAAALEDSRFEPVKPDELDHLSIEISVLSPLDVVEDPQQVQVGRDGLVISEGYCRGVLLPQVPVEWGWDREEFLCHTCTKAGLPEDAWRSGALIERFEAEVFGDDELQSG